MAQHPPTPPPPPEPPAFPPHGPHQPDKRPASGSTPGERREPALKQTVVRPARPSPDAVDGAFVANRLTSLTHELANLLEGSLRVVSLARRSLGRADTGAEHSNAVTETPIGELGRRLDTLQAAMTQMAELVRASMMGLGGGGIGGFRLSRETGSSLTDAVFHAVEVMRPLAEDRSIRLDVQLAPELDDLPAGPIYAVVANAVRNSIEAIERRGTPVSGSVAVRGWVAAGRTGRAVMLEVADDGVGPPRAHGDRSDQEGVFRLGYSTKPGGSGIGLAMSRDVVKQLGGTITLTQREKGPPSTDVRGGGAVLRVCYPAPEGFDEAGGGPIARAG